MLKPYISINHNKMYLLNSVNHEELNKKTISPFDDKRWISDDGIKTFPHGYKDLNFT